MAGLRRLFVELIVVSCAVCAAAVMVAGVLTALLSMAEARMKAGPVVMSHHVRAWAGAGPSVTPPLDVVTTGAVGAYSMRKLRAAYVGSSAQLRRASDNAVQDIGFTPSYDFDTAAATNFCNATTCFFAKWYDQSGNLRDMVQASTANQPSLTFGCTAGGQPCMRTNSSSMNIVSTNQATAGIVSYSVVAKRTAGTAACAVLDQTGNNRVQGYSIGTGWALIGNTGTSINVTPLTEAVWRSINAVTNGASSYMAIDGTTTTGNTTADTVTGPIKVVGAASTTCDEVEAIVWTGYALTAGDAAALNTNQHTYWGF